MTNANEALPITLTQNIYDVFNQSVARNEGMSFEALTVERPNDAFKLLWHAVEQFSQAGESVKSADGVRVTKQMDGEEAFAGFTKHALAEKKRDSDTQAFDVVVSIFQKPKLRDFIRGRGTEPKQLLAFRVEPPDLAF